MNREREPKERVHERFKVFAPDAGIRETLHENGSPGSFLNAGKDARKRSEEIEPQEFAPFLREGFTVVEWGGAEVD